jgi:hypothetical protein
MFIGYKEVVPAADDIVQAILKVVSFYLWNNNSTVVCKQRVCV